jgi:hypothetical protein
MFCGEGQLADLHRLMEEAAGILDLEAPELYVRQNPVPNAYTLAIAGRKPFVVIHTSLVELLTPAELQMTLAQAHSEQQTWLLPMPEEMAEHTFCGCETWTTR